MDVWAGGWWGLVGGVLGRGGEFFAFFLSYLFLSPQDVLCATLVFVCRARFGTDSYVHSSEGGGWKNPDTCQRCNGKGVTGTLCDKCEEERKQQTGNEDAMDVDESEQSSSST